MKKHWIKRVHLLPKGVCLLGGIVLALHNILGKHDSILVERY